MVSFSANSQNGHNFYVNERKMGGMGAKTGAI